MIYAALLVLAQAGENPHRFQCDNPRDTEEAAICEDFFTPTVAEDPPEPDDDCDDPQTQMRMNFCASLEQGLARAELDVQWEETAAAMRELDARIDREFDSQAGHYETLEESQRAWSAYRDAQCLAEGFLARGGSMQPMLENLCRAFLARQRIGQLRELTASLSVGE